MEIQLAQLCKEHFDEVSHVLAEAVWDTCRKNCILDDQICLSETDDKIGRVRRYLRSSQPEEYMICGIHNEVVVAVGGYSRCGADIVLNFDDAEAGDIEIGSIYVHPDFQRQGVGRAIFEALIARLREKKVLRAFVSSGYTTSQNYWVKVIVQPKLNLESRFGPNYRYMIWELKLLE